MVIWMESIYQMEHAISLCNSTTPSCSDLSCRDDAVEAWDAAVAYYAGSLEGERGSGTGVLLYYLADLRCQEFSTCAVDGTKLSGSAKSNIEAIRLFQAGQKNIMASQCEAAEALKNEIITLMTVPLIQSSLKYAHKLATKETSMKDRVEGASYAATILPLLHRCDPEDASIIYSLMGVNSDQKFQYLELKRVFER